MTEVTRILSALDPEDPRTAAQLLPLVYDELRRLASRKLAREKPGLTLQATGLVHEAFLRLVDAENAARWESRRHFFAAAAEAMRRILIEDARRKRGIKHGGRLQRVALDVDRLSTAGPSVDLLELDEALTRLAEESPVRAELVKLRFFAGLTVPDAAGLLGISVATAERHWTYARAWLFAELGDVEATGSGDRRENSGELEGT